MAEDGDESIELPENIKALADKCLDKHVQVVEAIVHGEYSSNTKAYQSVYPDADEDSANSSVARMLAIDSVSSLYEAMRDARLLKGILRRSEAMKILSDMARTTIGDLLEFGEYELGADAETGLPVIQSTWKFKNSEELSPSQLASISELTATKEGLKIKQHDQKAAIKQLSEIAGWELSLIHI